MGQRARIARQSSSPPMPGSITSSTTRCGDSRSTSALTSRPSPVVTTRKPSRVEVLADDVPDGGLVVDDEHGARRLHSAIVAGRTLRGGEFAGRPRALS